MKTPNHRRGFTLTELLVVIVIIAVLATFSMVGITRWLKHARSAQNMHNLRGLGITLQVIAQDEGSFPKGWGGSGSWADKVVASRNSGSSTVRQDSSLWSPVVNRDVPLNRRGLAVTNYASNPHLFPQGNFKVTQARLRRPGQQILIGDALPSSDSSPYGFTMTVMWGMRGAATSTNYASPNVSDPAAAERPVRLPEDILEMTNCGNRGLPAFRNSGKAQFVFADGHVEALRPNELKCKHFAISY